MAAVVVALVAATFPLIRFRHDPTHPGDFVLAWFGAHALLHGGDPYHLVGPGQVYDWQWSLIYPATATIVAMPFTILPQLTASIVFVAISTFLLAYCATQAGWFRLILFCTPAFAIAAGAAQWSPLLVCSLFMPAIGLLLAAKPNIGLAFWIAGTSKLRSLAIVGGVLLIGGSLVLLPAWPAEWIHLMRSARNVNAPVARLGGALVLLALVRWRRRETWLLVALACVPQTTYWYEVLPLFLIPSGLGEILLLAGTCSLGTLTEHVFMHPQDDVIYTHQVGILLVLFVYLPATVMILKRPNTSTPDWPRAV